MWRIRNSVKMPDLRAKKVHLCSIHYLINSIAYVILIFIIWHANLKARKPRWGSFTGQLAQGGGPWKSC